MVLLTNLLTEPQVSTDLDVMRAESQEWLNEIDFCTEEIFSYYNLLNSNGSLLGFPTKQLDDIEMIQISSVELTKVRNRVESHEREVSALIRGAESTEENEYRHQHSVLSNDIRDLRNVIGKFKEAIIKLVTAY